MNQTQINRFAMTRDNIQEKYINKTYDNMTYKDVIKILKRFEKIRKVPGSPGHNMNYLYF